MNFDLKAGQRWVLVGANGSGKSVLLRLLRGDMWPTPMPSGRARRQYYFDGESYSDPVEIKQRMAYLAPERQDKYVRYDWKLSVTQVATTGLFDEDIPLTKPTAAQQTKVQHMLKRFKLWSLRERSILSLSYGQRRRVLLARLLLSQPEVLLLDEVFNGIDAASRQTLLQLLNDPRRARTWILAAHSAEDIPERATHLARLQHGKLVYAGPIRSEDIAALKRDARTRHQRARRAVTVTPHAPATPVSGDFLLQLRQVELYRDYRPVLRKFDWDIAPGEHWAILGANGSGKSTLLMLIYGDLHPALGGVVQRAGHVQGTPIKTWKQRVGYVSPELQADHFASGTVEQIVASGRHASIGLNQVLSAADRRAAAPWLKFFGIEALRDRTPRQLSYGQMRLALLARAMVNRPQLLLLDEPFTGLDPDMHAHVMATLQRLSESGTQIIMAVHDASDILPAVSHVLRIGRGGRIAFAQT
ncbi:MAG: ATP-binding cassette domain-containing protein [Steroidobacteraceae bacterium]